MRDAWQRSSVVEQRNHNPLVGGPNPSAATRIQAGFIPVLILSDKASESDIFQSIKGYNVMKNQKNKKQITVTAFLMAVKNFATSVVNDFKDAQRELDAIRERMNQRSK